MGDTKANLRVGSKVFEVVIDLDEAMKIRKDQGGDVSAALVLNEIFYNSKSGEKASQDEMQKAFGTSDVFEVAERIIKKGHIELPQEYRDEEVEKKRKQIIDYFLRNAVDSRTNRPFTPDSLGSALDQSGFRITNKPMETQLSGVTQALKTIIPLKIETKKLAITIPAIYTGKAYGCVNEYKEKEDWLSDGSLKVIVNVPIGLQLEFYDKLNAVTHGAATSEEIKEN